jgi:thymidine kinase
MDFINNNTNSQTSSSTAYLEIIIGPMFSGKTSKLLNIYKQCKFCNIEVVVINHSLDLRYDSNMLSTHDKNMIPCYQMDKLYNLFLNPFNDSYKNAKVVLINEAQFFPDLEETVKQMLKDHKQIYISGLDGDFQQNKFGQILDLIPLCDKVSKYKSLCAICKNGTPGIFSKRLTSEIEQLVIGSDNYLPVCRNCK